MKKSYQLVVFFIAVYVIRLVISQTMGLMPQDAYYYFYSEHLDLSYFDHPPMVAYMLKFFSLILGKSVWTVKLTDFLVTGMSFFSFYYLSTLFLSKSKAKIAAMLYGSTLMLTILSVNTTPDVPLLLFWTLSLIAIYKAVFDGKLLYWILSGILIGLAFDSKYTALIILPGLIMFLILSKKHRHYLFSKELLLTFVFFGVTIYPVYLWNVQHEWISFNFQSSRTGDISKFNFQPKLFFGNLATQLFLILPILFSAIAILFYKLAKKMITTKKLVADKLIFLLSFSVPIIGLFFSISIIYWVKLNWIMPGYITAIILVSPFISKKMLKYQLITSLVLNILFFVQVAFYPFNVESDDTWYGWGELSEQVEIIKPDESFVFSADDYKTSAILNFYSDDRVYGRNVIGKQALQFSIVDSNLTHLEGKDAIFIDSDKRFKNLEKKGKVRGDLTPYFESIIEQNPIIIRDSKGKALRKFLVYKCQKYKGAEQ